MCQISERVVLHKAIYLDITGKLDFCFTVHHQLGKVIQMNLYYLYYFT